MFMLSRFHLQSTLPFIREHFKNPNWRYRDAAIMAFGSILDGPDRQKLTILVQQALPSLIEALKDPQVSLLYE